MFMLEYFHGFTQIKCSQKLQCSRRSFLEPTYFIQNCCSTSKYHEQKQYYQNWIKKPVFLRYDLLWVVNHTSYHVIRAHLIQNSIEDCFYIIMRALFGQTETDEGSCRNKGIFVENQRQRILQIIDLTLFIETELIKKFSTIVQYSQRVFLNCCHTILHRTDRFTTFIVLKCLKLKFLHSECITIKNQKTVMGAKALTAQQRAIKSDGKGNVQGVALLLLSLQQAQEYQRKLKEVMEEKIQLRLEEKQNLIDQKIEELDEKLRAREKIIGSQNSHFVKRLQDQQGKPFKEITGYTQAKLKLQNLKRKARRIHRHQKSVLLREIQQKRLDFVQKAEKKKKALPSLSKLGQRKKNKVLEDYVKKQHMQKEVVQTRKKVRKEFDLQFEFQTLYGQKIQKQLPDQQIIAVISDFEQTLLSSTEHKPTCGFC